MRILDHRGALLAETGGPLRLSLSQDEVPELVRRAFVAVEDRRFWEHDGVDLRGVARAALRNVRDRELAEGASTIPMQLVRTLWGESLRGVGPWRRKFIEVRTAPRLVRELGHERVLALYLNAIYLGNGVYGVERAARYYFGVGVADLDLAQVALLVGMTRSPESYEPRAHPERARAVRDLVLAMLGEQGIVTPEEAERARAEELGLARLDAAAPGTRRRTHFTAAVVRELRRVAPDLAAKPGLVVYTTLDADVQARGEAALAAQLAAIEAGRYGRFVGQNSADPLEGAAVALDAETGAVRAWIGGRDFGRSQFDRVTQARRQVGSLVKPFLVAAALERGYGIVDPVAADSVPIDTPQGTWLPADHVSEVVLPLREALVRSSNRAAAHLGVDIGLEALAELATRVGLSDEVPLVPASTLGAFEASLLDMTRAYAVLGNGGIRVEPYLIERVESGDGTLAWTRAPIRKERVLDPETAFVVLDALRAVVERGTAVSVRSRGFAGAAAGKTGTTNEGRDAWFVGLTPGLVTGVWIGFDRPREIVADRGGGALAAPVWGSWMDALEREHGPAALATGPRAGWMPPPGVEHVRYDPRIGEVLDRSCGGRFGPDFEEAWVHAGRYRLRTCPGGVLGWAERLWHVFVPRRLEPIRPLRPRARPGG
jgi:penicillin-binding protein 1A